MTDMTQAPTPGPLDSESVKLLRLGKPLDTRAAVGALCDGDWLRETWLGGRVHQWRHGMDIQDYRLPHTVFIGRPDESGWMPWSGGENPVPGKWCEWFFAHTGPYAGLSSDTLWDRVTRFRLAPTAPVEASGSERESEAWDWLGQLYPNDAPSDLAYDANEMIDAFLAGSGRSDRMAKALERIAGEQQYRSGYCQTDITVEPALSADEAQTVAREALAHNPAIRPQPSGETR